VALARRPSSASESSPLHPSRQPHPFRVPPNPSPETRKAYRLGKFLQNVHGLRRSSVWAAARSGSRQDFVLGVLEAVTYTGEGIYYFLDQFLW
jgi:hypothetical protein